MRALRIIFAAGLLALGLQPLEGGAVTITADYSSLGTVRIDANGNLVASGGTDVTALFKKDVNTAIDYWQNAVTKPWTVTINFQLKGSSSCGSLGSTAWVGCATTTSSSATAPNPITGGDIWFNSNTTSPFKYFIDSTPGDDSEFSMASGMAALGGGTVNSKRRGTATGTGGATGRWDLLTLALHEIEHLLGFSSGTTIYTNAVVATPSPHIVIDKTMSGLTSNFDLPVKATSAHIDADADATFKDTVVAAGAGEWADGERAKITGVDILGVCQINQCTNAQMNLNPVPEPGTGLLAAFGIAGLAVLRRPRRAADRGR